MSATNQTNNDIPFIHTSSNIVTQTVEINNANSLSKLNTENINDNIKNTNSDINIEYRICKNNSRHVNTKPSYRSKIRQFHVTSDREKKLAVP